MDKKVELEEEVEEEVEEGEWVEKENHLLVLNL